MGLRYRLTSSLLENSTNPYIKLVAKDNFYFNNNTARIPFGAKEQLAADIGRNWTVNGKSFAPHLLPLKPIYKKQLTSSIIKGLFPEKTATQILTYHCQNPMYLLGGNTFNQPKPTHKTDETSTFFSLSPDSAGQCIDIYNYEGQAYFTGDCSGYRGIDTENCDEFDLKNHNLNLTCVATNKGYLFLEQNTDSMVLYDLLMGAKPESIEWYTKRDKNKWSWLERNSRIFEPIFPDSYLEPFTHRIKNTFHRVFNPDNPYTDDASAFIGWGGHIIPFILSGRFIIVFKNLIKCVTEFIPALVEETGNYLLDHSKQFFSIPENNSHSINKAAAGAGFFFGTLFHTIGKVTREITMRITSPIQAAMEAYEFGLQNQGKILGYALGTLSALSSLAALGTFVFISMPFVAAALTTAIISIATKIEIALAAALTVDRIINFVQSIRQKRQTEAVLQKITKESEVLAKMNPEPDAKQEGSMDKILKILKRPDTSINAAPANKPKTTKQTSPTESFSSYFSRKAAAIGRAIKPAATTPKVTTKSAGR